MTDTIENNKVLYFAEGNTDALNWMSYQDIIKHLKKGGFRVEDLSTRPSLNELNKRLKEIRSFGEMDDLVMINGWHVVWHWHYPEVRMTVFKTDSNLSDTNSAMIDADGVVCTGDYAYQEILEVWEELNNRMAV